MTPCTNYDFVDLAGDLPSAAPRSIRIVEPQLQRRAGSPPTQRLATPTTGATQSPLGIKAGAEQNSIMEVGDLFFAGLELRLGISPHKENKKKKQMTANDYSISM